MRTGSNITSHGQLQGVTANQHHNQVHTHTDHTDQTAYVWFGPAASGGAPAATIVGTAPNLDATFAANDAADTRFIWYWVVPAGYVSGLAFTAWWYTLGGSASGNYSCRVNMCLMAVGNAIGTTGSTTTILIAERADNNIGSQAITAPITVLNPGDLYRIAFERLGSTDAAADTATGIMRFIGLAATFTNNN